ncbi:MAG: hypothetical protein B7Y39_01920 [Bdellovibrio sp. 28-41-41]|nr:MAG: hypothetical protein B7Y39_01920 [Bdellovibrio sp. 28-41-41]
MNAKTIINQSENCVSLRLAEAITANPTKLNFWSRLALALSQPDLNLETWERLESKRAPTSFSRQQQWRNY